MTARHRMIALTAIALAIVGARSAWGAGGPTMAMGKTISVHHPAFQAFYDGHKDTIFNLDVSNKTEAAMDHINYAPDLKLVPLTTPEIYFVVGTAATGQLAVLGSEPGEKDYTPIWREVHVSFKSGQTPVLLKSDAQIEGLMKKGTLTETETSTRLNCPVIKVGKG
jgi:hypothetical protein